MAKWMQKNITYSQILDSLTDLVDSRSSGTMFIHSNCNHAITIAIAKGRIHTIYFGAKRGRKAIPLISSISGGSYRFEISDFVETSQNLPPTPEVLNLLRNPQTSNESNSILPPPLTSKETVRIEQKDTLCQELKSLFAMHMGPIADIVFDDIVDEVGDFCSTPQLTNDLINKLSEEIENTAEMKEFKNKAYTVLNNILKS
jgi:hypothetical protein